MSPEETTTDIMRYRPPSALYAKRPASAAPAYRTELMSAGPNDRWSLVAQANRMQARGEITIIRRPVWSEVTGQWTMVIRRLKPPPPRWRKPAIITAVALTVLSVLTAAAWWALSTLATTPGLVLLGLVFVLFVSWVASNGPNGSAPRIIDVIVRVIVR